MKGDVGMHNANNHRNKSLHIYSKMIVQSRITPDRGGGTTGSCDQKLLMLALESQWRFVYIFWKLRVPWKDRLITF